MAVPAAAVLAAAEPLASTDSVDWFPVLAGLLGGVALLLLGLQQLTTALKAMAGDRLRVLLARLTSNRLAGVTTGATVTAVVQSSSVTAVLVIGFVDAALMALGPSLAVLLGAKVGTTVTAQVVAFDIEQWALALVAIGFGLTFFTRSERLGQRGTVLLGLGLVFFGMQVAGDAIVPLRTYEPFLDLMTRLEQPVLGVLAGAVVTAVIQSSSATTVVTITLAAQGVIGLEAGVAIMLGANVGTCVTAVIAAVGKSRDAMRAALGHVVFNLIGALVWIVAIDQLVELTEWLSPEHTELSGSERVAAEAPRQLANAHTVFNLVNVVLFLPFLGPITRGLRRVVPDRPPEVEDAVAPIYLDDDLLGTPALALDRVRLELGHLGSHVLGMLERVPDAVLRGDRADLDALERRDDDVDRLYLAIVDHLRELSRRDLTEEQARVLLTLMELANDLENIGDVVETNLVALGRRRLEVGLRVSPATRAVIERVHRQVRGALLDALAGVVDDDEDAARRATDLKPTLNAEMAEALRHQADRLVADEPIRLAAYTIELDILENLRRVYYFAKRIARARLGASVVLEE